MLEEKKAIRYIVWEGPGILIISDVEWQRGSGINIRLKSRRPEDLRNTFNEVQIKRSVELWSAIEKGKVKVLSEQEYEAYAKVPEVVEIPEEGIKRNENDRDPFLDRLKEIEDKTEKEFGRDALRMTPRRRKVKAE